MNQPHEVIVKDVQMPFWSMVVFLIKLAFASIPAIVVVWATIFILSVTMWAVIGGLALATLGGASALSSPTPTASPLPTKR